MQYHESDCDLADDELQRIVNLKEDMTRWLDSVWKLYSEQSRPQPGAEIYNYIAAEIEESFDDLLHACWHRNSKVSGSLHWTTQIPTCEFLRAQIAKEKMRFKRPVNTNPATGDNHEFR